MNPLAFFRSDDVQKVIQRAARIAGCPISLHAWRDGEESPRILTIGGCAACGMVAQAPIGRESCAASRMPGANRTMKRGIPAPFLCHMGFACVSVAPLVHEGAPYVLTLGPYCPSAGILAADAAPLMNALEAEARQRLAHLDVDVDDASILEDVPVAHADAVPAIADWLADTLRALWYEANPDAAVAQPALDDPADTPRRGRYRRPDADPYGAAAIAAAVVAGNRSRLRRLIQVALGESQARRGSRRTGDQARALAVVGASMEALARAGTELRLPWDGLKSLAECLPKATHEEWPGLLARLLIDSSGLKTTKRAALLTRVDEVLSDRMADGVTLNEVAQQLGCSPSAVTHALQRKFGMSYTQYVGRLRVAAAKEMLRRTKLTPTEIGRRVGVPDPSNFSRLFKKFENMTPLEYRTRSGGKE